MRTYGTSSLVATVVLAAALVTGCGEGDDGGGEDFANKSADEISEAAKESMGDLDAVTIEGTLSSDGQEIELSMSIGSGRNCTGSFTTQGATAEVLGVDGAFWFRPDEAFWELYAGPEVAPQLASAAGDKWVALPEDDTSFTQFCDLEEFLGELTDSDDGATYTKGEVEEIDGEETIEIISDRPDEGTSSGYILTEGAHYLVRISKTEGEDPGEVSFSGFDDAPDVEVPADDEQISLEELEQGGY